MHLNTFILVTLAVLFRSARCDEPPDFQMGFTAYKSGDYATALRNWTPLVEQGHVTAQFNLCVMYRDGQEVTQDNVHAHM